MQHANSADELKLEEENVDLWNKACCLLQLLSIFENEFSKFADAEELISSEEKVDDLQEDAKILELRFSQLLSCFDSELSPLANSADELKLEEENVALREKAKLCLSQLLSCFDNEFSAFADSEELV